jgi:sulfatase maturation enzyme AslB (radical SAM superfamily)
VSAIICVGKYNREYLHKTLDYIVSLGVNSIKLNPVTNSGRGLELDKKGLIFDENDLLEFYENYKILREKYDVNTMMPPCLDTLTSIAKR